MIVELYKAVEEIVNKEQFGYLKPMRLDLFAYKAMVKERNKYISDYKTNVRKSNWHLDGKGLADYSEHKVQMIEYFSAIKLIAPPYDLPLDNDFIVDIFSGDRRVDKVTYKQYMDLKTNIYAKPTSCSPVFCLLGEKILVNPSMNVELHYLRHPKKPKWTFNEVEGKPMFDPTKSDFQDIDMPKSSFDELVSSMVEDASRYLRDFGMVQSENADQIQDYNIEKTQ